MDKKATVFIELTTGLQVYKLLQFLIYATCKTKADTRLLLHIFISPSRQQYTYNKQSAINKLEKAAQGVAQWEVSATRVVVDAALLRGGKSRRGGHRIANISRNCGRI